MSSIVKRCSVVAVLALAALLPDFRLLRTSRDGLALLADLEGCRLRPYQRGGMDIRHRPHCRGRAETRYHGAGRGTKSGFRRADG